jgi:hypothetical protein
MSSYSYMIVPTNTTAPFTADKGATLGQFILYFVCAGQQKAEELGYAPLPRNLVQRVFTVEQKIPGAPKPPALSDCHNPTIDGTYNPPEPVSVAPPSASGSGSGGSAGASSRGRTAAKTAQGAKKSARAAGAGAAGSASAANGGAADASTATDQDPTGELVSNLAPVSLPKTKAPVPLLFYVAASIAVLLLIFGPPAYALWLRRRRPPV